MKKIIAMLLVLVGLAALTGCGANGGQTTTVTEEPSSVETTQPATWASVETTQPATWDSGETTEPATDESTEAPTDEEDETADEWSSFYDEDGELYAKERHQDGKLMEEIWYEDEEESSRRVYSYEDGQTTVSFYESQSLKYVKSWDANGKPLVYTNYVLGKPVWRNTFTYDKDGSLTGYHSDVLNEQGNPVWKVSVQGGDIYGDGVYGTEYFYGGTEQWCRSYTYYDNGELLGEQKEDIITGEGSYRRFYFYDDDDHLMAIFNTQSGQEYEAGYDEQGRILYEIEYCDPESDDTNYSYDENGLKTGYHIGATYGSSDLIYDEEDRLILDIFYGDEEEESRTSYEYNEQGDVTQEVYSDVWSEGDEIHTYAYTYREDGQWSEKICFCNGEEESRVIRVYNEAGQLVEETDADQTITFTYNDAGQLIREDWIYEGSQETKYHLYSYDDLGRLSEEICIFS